MNVNVCAVTQSRELCVKAAAQLQCGRSCVARFEEWATCMWWDGLSVEDVYNATLEYCNTHVAHACKTSGPATTRHVWCGFTLGADTYPAWHAAVATGRRRGLFVTLCDCVMCVCRLQLSVRSACESAVLNVQDASVSSKLSAAVRHGLSDENCGCLGIHGVAVTISVAAAAAIKGLVTVCKQA